MRGRPAQVGVVGGQRETEIIGLAGLGVLVAGVILVAFAPLYQMIAGL